MGNDVGVRAKFRDELNWITYNDLLVEGCCTPNMTGFFADDDGLDDVDDGLSSEGSGLPCSHRSQC